MTIKLAAEMPHSYLETHGNLFHYEFCLTHMAEQSKTYLDFYIKQNKKGRITILDNSVFELGKPVNTDRVLNIYKQLPNKKNVVIVAPDVFGDGQKTIQQFEAFVKELNQKLGSAIPLIMGVAQGKDWNDWLDCYKFLASHDKVNVIGVPYELKFDVPSYNILSAVSKTHQKMWRRIYVFQKLQDLGLISYKWHHLLGSSDPAELYYQSSVLEIKSMDTSIPFVEAIEEPNQGKPFGESTFIQQEKAKRSNDYFEKEYNSETAEVAAENIKTMKLWASGRRRITT